MRQPPFPSTSEAQLRNVPFLTIKPWSENWLMCLDKAVRDFYTNAQTAFPLMSIELRKN